MHNISSIKYYFKKKDEEKIPILNSTDKFAKLVTENNYFVSLINKQIYMYIYTCLRATFLFLRKKL